MALSIGSSFIEAMKSPSINPNLKETLQTSAASKAALVALQHASVPAVLAAQRIFQGAALAEQILGAPFEDQPNELMGYMTPAQVLKLQRQVRELKLTRKNLFYLRITDTNPPNLYGEQSTSGPNLSGVPYWLLDLIATDVSYSHSVNGDKVQFGSAVMDKVTGLDAMEIQITSYDDDRGTLKRWFDAKMDAMVPSDGTFGLPRDYCFDLEIVHGIPSHEIPGEHVAMAYKTHARLRPATISIELSRRDQAFQELQMTFTQFDTWTKKK